MTVFKFHVLLSKCTMMVNDRSERLDCPADVTFITTAELDEVRELAAKYDKGGTYTDLIKRAQLKKDVFDLNIKYMSFIDIIDGSVPMSLDEWLNMKLKLADSAIAWVPDPESYPYRLAHKVEMDSRRLCDLDGFRKVRKFRKAAGEWVKFCTRIKEAESC